MEFDVDHEFRPTGPVGMAVKLWDRSGGFATDVIRTVDRAGAKNLGLLYLLGANEADLWSVHLGPFLSSGERRCGPMAMDVNGPL